MTLAPCALAFERYLECRLYAGRRLSRPILDLGCGEGLFAKVLFSERLDTGVDPNPKDLARARELDAYVELIQCHGDAVPKPGDSYNTIIANSVLEHIPVLEPVFREVHRLLAAGGRFYFTVPSERFSQYTVLGRLLSAVGLPRLAARWRGAYDAFWRHYHAYPEAEWGAIARRCGFEVVHTHSFDPKWICLLNDLLVPLSLPMLVPKRLINRWTLCPALRRVLIYPLFLLARRLLEGGDQASQGGLVFMALAKPRGTP
jgi:SAM-dependent methyltransferase